MKTTYIYLLRNKITGGIYIGQTNNPQRRYWEHRSKSKKNPSLQPKLFNAINKYGFENFEMEILEEVPSELKDMKEEYYISKLNALSDENYNEVKGLNLLKNINHQLIIDDYLKGISASKIGQKYNVKHPQVIKILKAELGEEEYLKLSKKHTLNKKNIPIETIVDLIENQGYTKKETANILGVCDSTIVRRYNRWKKKQDPNYIINPNGKGFKKVDVDLILNTYSKVNSTRETCNITGYSRKTVQKYLRQKGVL
jgi:group I intron endonuclease